jgi:hypothetical protein
MAIYENPVRILLLDMIKALAPSKDVHFTRTDALGWFATHYPLIKEGTIAAHLIRFSTNAPSRIHYSAKKEEDLLYQIDSEHFRLYDAANDRTPIHTKVDIQVQPDIPTGGDEIPPSITSNEFAYEKDLQSFLVKNLSIFEPGLKLYQEDGISGIEYPAGGRFIDILAVDSQNRLVVIELKVSKGYDRVIGQTLRYMAWISKHLAEQGQAVRGIIAARDISDDLRLACSYLPNVSLYEYELSVTMQKVLIDSLEI